MSNADPTELDVVVRSDGVTVEKSYEPDDFPVPAIAFVVRSEREETVDVRLVDQVPEEAEPDDIGFHPKFGAEFWSVEDETIVFERSFEAGEEYTTVYGLRASETDDLESYLTEPDLEEVDPPLSESEKEEGDVEPLDLSDPTDGTTEPSDDIEAALSEVDADAGDFDVELASNETVVTTGDRDIVGELAAALRTGSVDDDDLATLRNALVEGAGDSVDARIQQLQSNVADLTAYTTALEEFLDEDGDAQQVLDDLRTAVDDLRGEVATVAGRAEENAQRIDRVDSDLSTVDEELEELNDVADRVDTLADDVAEMEAQLERVDDLEESVASVEADLEVARDDIETLREMRDRLTSVFGEQMRNAGDD